MIVVRGTVLYSVLVIDAVVYSTTDPSVRDKFVRAHYYWRFSRFAAKRLVSSTETCTSLSLMIGT